MRSEEEEENMKGCCLSPRALGWVLDFYLVCSLFSGGFGGGELAIQEQFTNNNRSSNRNRKLVVWCHFVSE
jgi:hypothetical protein